MSNPVDILKPWKTIPLALLIFLIFTSCTSRTSTELDAENPPFTQTVGSIPISETPIILSPTASLEDTPTPFPTPTGTASETPTPTYTMTPIPTYIPLRGEVIVEHASCRYGPGVAYLYKYGLVGGSNLEIIGRMELLAINEAGDWGMATWLHVRAFGGDNPCWVNARLMQVKGELANVQPVAPEEVALPPSPYYGPLAYVTAERNGGEVTISWNGITLRAGDDSEQFPYLIEAWVCRDGQLAFAPVGSYALKVDIPDEAGCSEPSHGRIYAVEKHGYTRWITIPWPP